MHQSRYHIDGDEEKEVLIGSCMDGDIGFSIRALDILSNEEIVLACRWLQKYREELWAIEFIREHRIGEQNCCPEEKVVEIALATDCEWMRKHLLEEVKKYRASKPPPKYIPRPSEPLPGFVYLMKGGDYHKIGLSVDPKNRRQQIATGMPFNVELIHTISTDDMKKAEKHLHKLFAEKRVGGEWFELDEADVEQIMGIEVL